MKIEENAIVFDDQDHDEQPFLQWMNDHKETGGYIANVPRKNGKYWEASVIKHLSPFFYLSNDKIIHVNENFYMVASEGEYGLDQWLIKQGPFPGGIDSLGNYWRQIATDRFNRKLTQKQLAEQLGVHARTITELERGFIPKVLEEKAKRLAEYLGTRPDIFIYKYREPRPKHDKYHLSPDQTLLNVAQVASMFRVMETTVQDWVRSGSLPAQNASGEPLFANDRKDRIKWNTVFMKKDDVERILQGKNISSTAL